MTFGEKLQKLRSREGLSQDALAERLGVTRQAVSKWERDETMPEAEKIVRISDCFSVTTDYLLKDGPEKFPGTSRRLPDLEAWYREKGYQLGWLLFAAGGIYALRSAPSVLTSASAFWEQGLAVFALYMLPGLLAALCGLLAAVGGRRYAGRLRGSHLGWLGVLAGGSGCFWLGSVWLVRNLDRVLKNGSEVYDSAGTFDGWQAPLAAFVLLILLGLLILWVGGHRDRRNGKEQPFRGSSS